MIFSSSLGSVEKYTTDAAIKSIANHVRKLQEELEYRLAHLDSTNINEIDAEETVIRGGPITLISQHQDEIAKLQLTDQQIVASVQGLGDSMSHTVRIAADGVTITNAAGSALTIDGGQINAENLNLTGKIKFDDLNDDAKEIISGYDAKTYLESIGVTEITKDGVKSPRIVGGEIYGGLFSDLEADSYIKLLSSQQDVSGLKLTTHMMVHYVGDAVEDASASVPLTAMGWSHLEGEKSQWALLVLGETKLKVIDGVVYPTGVWNFKDATVYGL